MLRRVKTFLSRLSIIFVSIIVTLLLLEILVRLIAPQVVGVVRPDIWQAVSDGRGHALRPNMATTISTGERIAHVYTDRYGHRITPDYSPQNPEIRILAIGDSFVEALQVEYEDSFTYLLQEQLADELNVSVEVVNTGVSAYDPNHYRIVQTQELARADYDLVIVFFFIGNDLVSRTIDSMPPRASGEPQFRTPQSIADIYGAWIAPLNWRLQQVSHLYVLTKNSIRGTLRRVGLSPWEVNDSLLTANAELDAWEITANILARQVQDADDMPVLIVLLPVDIQVLPNRLDTMLRDFALDPEVVDIYQPARILGQLFDERGVDYFDLAPAFSTAYEQGVPDLYGDIDRHLDLNGHQVVTSALLPIILDRLAVTATP